MAWLLWLASFGLAHLACFLWLSFFALASLAWLLGSFGLTPLAWFLWLGSCGLVALARLLCLASFCSASLPWHPLLGSFGLVPYLAVFPWLGLLVLSCPPPAQMPVAFLKGTRDAPQNDSLEYRNRSPSVVASPSCALSRLGRSKHTCVALSLYVFMNIYVCTCLENAIISDTGTM